MTRKVDCVNITESELLRPWITLECCDLTGCSPQLFAGPKAVPVSMVPGHDFCFTEEGRAQPGLSKSAKGWLGCAGIKVCKAIQR